MLCGAKGTEDKVVKNGIYRGLFSEKWPNTRYSNCVLFLCVLSALGMFFQMNLKMGS